MSLRRLRQLVIDIIEDYSGKTLLYLEHVINYDTFIGHFVDGTEGAFTFRWILERITELLNRKV